MSDEVANRKIEKRDFTRNDVKSGNDRNDEVAEINVSFKSTKVGMFFASNVGVFMGAMGRLGILFKMTSEDPETYKKIIDWHKELLSAFDVAAKKVNTMILAAADNIDMNTLTPVKENNAQFTLEFNHPKPLVLFKALKRQDELCYDIQKLYFNDLFDDAQRQIVDKQAFYPAQFVVDSIYRATNIGNRDGGKFRPNDFLALLKNEESVSSMLKKRERQRTEENQKRAAERTAAEKTATESNASGNVEKSDEVINTQEKGNK